MSGRIPRSGRPRRISNTSAGRLVAISRIFGRLWPLTVVVVLAVGFAEAAHGCSVCFGDPDSAMTEGVNRGILFLLACVGIVQIGFLALFWSFRNRARRLERQRDRFSLIEGGVK